MACLMCLAGLVLDHWWPFSVTLLLWPFAAKKSIKQTTVGTSSETIGHFPSCVLPLRQNEATCENHHMNVFHLQVHFHTNQTHFQKKEVLHEDSLRNRGARKLRNSLRVIKVIFVIPK